MFRIGCTIWAIILPLVLFGQCDGLIASAEKDIVDRSYKPAIDKLLLLQEECPGQSRRINTLIQETFALIERDRFLADSLATSFERSNRIMKAILDRQRKEGFDAIKAGNLPELYVLIVAIGDYKDNSMRLNGPKNDFDITLDSWGRSNWLFNKVHNYVLRDSFATKANIKRRIREVTAQSRPDDVVYIHFSGHGVPAGPNSGSFITYDLEDRSAISSTDLLSGGELFELLVGEDAFVMLSLDFCRGDQILSLFREALNGDNPQYFLHRVFGFGLIDVAYEHRFRNKTYGALSYASARVVSNANYDTDKNGVLYLDEYFRGIKQELDKIEIGDNGKKVGVVVPATISNIPVRQFRSQFTFPIKEAEIKSSH